MKYNIIHLNGFMYAVDKAKRVPNQDEWFYNLVTNTIHQLKEVPEGFLEISNRKIGLWTILIASNDPSLNLPLLPTVEEISFKGFNEVWHRLIMSIPPLNRTNVIQFTEEAKNIWKAGYKAAKAKQFTEEDLKDAMKVAMKQASSGSSFDDRDFINRHIQSLTPKPIAVEFKTETICYCGHTTTCDCGQEPDKPFVKTPKTDSTNHVIVKQWYFNV